jgi:hypothetical protein
MQNEPNLTGTGRRWVLSRFDATDPTENSLDLRSSTQDRTQSRAPCLANLEEDELRTGYDSTTWFFAGSIDGDRLMKTRFHSIPMVILARPARRPRVHWLSTSKLKTGPPQESRQLDVNLRQALAPNGMTLRHVAAERVGRHKFQLQTYGRGSRIQHPEQPPVGNSLPASRKDRLNMLNGLVQDAHKKHWGPLPPNIT